MMISFYPNPLKKLAKQRFKKKNHFFKAFFNGFKLKVIMRSDSPDAALKRCLNILYLNECLKIPCVLPNQKSISGQG